MASGGGWKRVADTCPAWDGGARARGRNVVEGNAPFLCGDGSSLHGGCETSIAPGCGSWASLLACGSPWEMQSGCGGASRVVLYRDDGGGGGGVVDGIALRGCDDVTAACSSSSHANGRAMPPSPFLCP